ncbi:MAG: ADP-ribosylglycohydrolase [Spirosomataceae bacterium]|jgi:ADP-ribosylglycohydrolase
MGAPTEMWHRDQIRIQGGYVSELTTLYRPDSPEGPWEDFMEAGSTTDDTRWKYLTTKFLTQKGSIPDSLNAKDFADFLVDRYLNEMKALKSIEAFDPEPVEKQLKQMNWLQEWAKVAKAYTDGDIDEYSYARDRFYGGEMACAGMLYAPMIGGVYPTNPNRAYLEAFRLGIFDIGYARDITGLTAAMTARAMKPGVTYNEITAVCYETDPLRYENSRLVGRLAYQSYQTVKNIVAEAKRVETPSEKILKGFSGNAVELAQLNKAYELMDAHLQQIPFHAGEIHLINLAAIEFAEGDFQKAVEFAVNYGRDNDTVAAVTGAVLGAMHGFDQLPVTMREKTLSISKNVIRIDLEQLAQELTDAKYN